jgi:hypothetical protein
MILSVDKYGLWSEWWREHFIKHSDAYKPEQLYVSGPMRPLGTQKKSDPTPASKKGRVRVLFISEQVAVPEEVMPYLYKLLKQKDIELTIKFRPYRDGFERWLLKNEPQVLKMSHVRIVKGAMQEAIQNSDVAVGCQSTGVLEMLLQFKVPIYFRTQKWGDYYDIKNYNRKHSFFAENPGELIEKIKNAKNIPVKYITDLRERYFGDPYKNGSQWVVEQMEKILEQSL